MNSTFPPSFGEMMAGSVPVKWRENWYPLIPAAIAIYVMIVRSLRFQRRNALHRRYRQYGTKEGMASMTNDDAQSILAALSELEFPFTMVTSLQFGLFRTYGIPTISKLLVATKELSTRANASKRYADTTVLISEFASHPPRSERAIKAIARMNFLHGNYQRSGKISNDDLLYTLSVFIIQPIEWVDKYEWRKLTPMEKCAISTFWKSMGDAMGIAYDDLRHFKEGWADGLEFYEDILEWSRNYERRAMVPAASNKQTADETTALLLYWVPAPFKPMGIKVISVIMDDILRKAMMYSYAPQSYYTVVDKVVALRKFVLRNFTLPRPEFLAVRDVSDAPDPKNGRYYSNSWQAHPWYVKPTLWRRWGPEGLFVRIMGGDVPGSNNGQYASQGYRFEEVGPRIYSGKGMDVMQNWEKKLERERPSGCPFAMKR